MLAGGVVVRVTIINDASIKREACNLVERTRTYSSELKSRETRNRGVEHAVLDGWQHSDPHAISKSWSVDGSLWVCNRRWIVVLRALGGRLLRRKDNHQRALDQTKD